jgi:hypothetical protein
MYPLRQLLRVPCELLQSVLVGTGIRLCVCIALFRVFDSKRLRWEGILLHFQ